MNIKTIREYKNYLEEFIGYAESLSSDKEFDYKIQSINEHLPRGFELREKIAAQLNVNNFSSQNSKDLLSILNKGSLEDYLEGNL